MNESSNHPLAKRRVYTALKNGVVGLSVPKYPKPFICPAFDSKGLAYETTERIYCYRVPSKQAYAYAAF